MGLSFPALKKTVAGIQLDSAAKRVYYLCLFLQERAQLQKQIHCLKINPQTGAFKPFILQSGLLVDIPGRGGKSYTLVKEITIESTQEALYFYPDSTIDTGSIQFTDSANNMRTISTQAGTNEIKFQ